MMPAVRVGRLRARMRVPAASGDAGREMGGALRRMLDETLEAALGRLAVGPEEHLLVRRLRVPARVRLVSPELDRAAAWAAAVADAVGEAARRGGPDVVRYPSEAHALADLLRGVARGDLRRAWAWRRLGLWDAPESPSGGAAADALLRALAARPERVVPLLSAAASAGLLPALLRRLPPPAWTTLARAAVAAAVRPQGRPSPFDRPNDSLSRRLLGAPAPSVSPASPTTFVEEDGSSAAVRVLRASAVAGAASSSGSLPGEVRRALAVIAVAEAEPAAFVRDADHAERIAAAVERSLPRPASPDVPRPTDADRRRRVEADARAALRGSAARSDDTDRLDEAPSSTVDPSPAPADASADAAPSTDSIRDAEDARRSASRPRASDDGDSAASADDASSRSASPDAGADVDASADATTMRDARPSSPSSDDRRPAIEPVDADASVDATSHEEAEEVVPDLRRSGRTEWGGLLFLLNVVSEPDLLDLLLRGEALRDRSPRWTLHRLATALLPLADDDPAALAFAGLRPGDDPPTADAPPTTDAEEEALTTLATRIAERTAERLGNSLLPGDADPAGSEPATAGGMNPPAGSGSRPPDGEDRDAAGRDASPLPQNGGIRGGKVLGWGPTDETRPEGHASADETPHVGAPDRSLPRLRGRAGEGVVSDGTTPVEARTWNLEPGTRNPPVPLLRRPATVVADPGWIELRMPLDSVDVSVRRAGLDLDPGWIPWLGTVVRFAYGHG